MSRLVWLGSLLKSGLGPYLKALGTNPCQIYSFCEMNSFAFMVLGLRSPFSCCLSAKSCAQFIKVTHIPRHLVPSIYTTSCPGHVAPSIFTTSCPGHVAPSIS